MERMFKLILIVCFVAVLIALWSSFFFLMKDRGHKRRMINMLFARVGLSLLLLGLIIYGYYSGNLILRAPPF